MSKQRSKPPKTLKRKPSTSIGLFPVLLIILALVKIGRIPLLIGRKTGKAFRQIVRFGKRHPHPVKVKVVTKRIVRKNIHKFSLSLPKITLPRIGPRRRGRPRLQPLLPFYLKRLKKALFRLIPKPARFKIALVTIFLAVLIYSQLLVKLAANLPSPHEIASTPRPQTTQIYDRHGKLLYQIYDGQNRQQVELKDLPPDLINATIATEDKHFFTHPGVDFLGILRALKIDFAKGDLQGGSTITQQLVKNTLLTPDQTLKRKVEEVILALWTEAAYSKEQILRMYFNQVPYGGPAWGIAAASDMYFSKKPAGLNLAEAAYLAGLPASPTQYSPYGSHPEKGIDRQKEVLRRMVEDGYISQKQADEALGTELSFRPPTNDIKAPHFVMYVRSLLADKYGEKVVSGGGLRVTTTLDWDIQQMAEQVVADQIIKLQSLNVGNGAAMVTDPRNGQIMAMVGSKDYFDPDGGNFNVVLSPRQPGSSIKPVTYATAFKLGYTPGTVLLDVPTTFSDEWGNSYSPVNYDGKFHGAVTIRTALGSSFNIPAVKTLAMVGVPAMLQTARDLGITTFNTPDRYGLSLTLGAGEVKMVDMMSVYGTLASGGIRYTPQPILTVTDSQGDVLEDHTQAEGKRVLTEQIAYLLSSILSDNEARIPAFGPHSLLEIPNHTVAVKTGTTDSKKDNWAFGYTPEYTVGVWVGNNNNAPMNQALTSGITGATPIWHDIMISLTSDRPNIAFSRPAGIVEAMVDGHKDLTISGQLSKTVISYKKEAKKDEVTGTQKDVITYTDPFNTFVPNNSAASQ